MPLSISTEATKEKNKLSSSDPWLIFLKFTYGTEDPIRVVWNTEDVDWAGYTWNAAAFELGEEEQSTDSSVPTVSLKCIDIERRLTPTVDLYDGAIGAKVNVYFVHSNYLDSSTPEHEVDFIVVDTSIDYQNIITFKLGAENLSNYRSPSDRYLKSHCRYKEFKGSLCGYSGGATDCDHTWTRCKELGNQRRFGGFPGIGRIGLKG